MDEAAATLRDELEHLVEESAVFGLLQPAAQSFVCEHLEVVNLPGGAVLIQEGEAADCLYLVAVGRLRVSMRGGDGTERVIAELGRGEVVGELAVITNEPRSATVTALRDSEVFKLSTSAFAQLVEEHPEALREIATPVVRRLVRSLREGSPSSPVVTIAVVPLGADPGLAEFGARLYHALKRLTGAATHVNALTVAASLGDLTRVSAERLALWFGEHDARSKAVVYQADTEPTPWTDTCLRQADLVLLVGSSREPPGLRPVELAIAERRQRLQTRTELVLVHPPTTRDPRGTRRWLELREVDRHHHVRTDRGGDVERVARLILGRGIGVVFSGGGARGIAAIGVLRALEEHGVPIDATGGTSIGSLIAGAAARGLSLGELTAMMRAAVVDSSAFDITFPAVSLAAGKRVTQRIREAADGLDVEDTWCNFFCVSTNLTTGGVEIHRRGPGWYAVRASFSIPGVFPPVPTTTGDLLVDGGLLDNLPVGVMRAEHHGITVIAVDVGRTRDLSAGSLPNEGVVSGWKLLLGRLDRGAPSRDTAGLGHILMRLTELGSEQNHDRGDLYIHPAVDPFGVADFKAFDRLIQLGYEAGDRAVIDWLADQPRF